MLEAWAPFAEGKNGIFQNEILTEIGNKYGKSVAQMVIRWLVEQDIIVLTKTVHLECMVRNSNGFDFSLTEEDKAKIAMLDVVES